MLTRILDNARFLLLAFPLLSATSALVIACASPAEDGSAVSENAIRVPGDDDAYSHDHGYGYGYDHGYGYGYLSLDDAE